VLRADFFENYAGRFLSVEAKTRLGGSTPTGAMYTGPVLSLSYNSGPGTPIDSEPVLMDVNIDPDTSPDTYIEHRELVRVGDVGSTARPTRIRIGSETGSTIEAPVEVWLGGGLPPMKDGYLSDFTTRYMDPTEVYQRFDALAAEFSNIAELIPLPHKTNGYQRRAQALMAGTTDPGDALSSSTTNPAAILARSRAVVLTSRAWGHEGGNQIGAEFINPGVANEPLTVTMSGNVLTARLATDGAAQATSTAAQVVQAINANADANRLLVANTYRGNAGEGVVQPRTLVHLSDFLSAPSHVKRGPYEYSVMRITGDSRGKQRKQEKVGVFLYCQQHAREWATPLTCLETAEQLLRNYAIDRRTRELVDNLEIYILPSSNPDGSHYSMYDFNFQRRNLTNHCVVGGKETDDPFAANFWTPRTRPDDGQPYTNTDPGIARRVGRRPEPQQHVRHDLRRLHRRVLLVHERRVCGSGRGIRAGDQERALDRGHVRQHQVLEQHPQLRRLLHVGAGHVPAGPRRGRRRAREHRRREVLLRGRRPDPQPDQGGAQHRDPAGAHRPDRRRALLRRRQQRRRALVQPRRHRLLVRDGRGPLRGHRAHGRRPASASPTARASTSATG
jgi:hypothetical protein